MRLAFIADVHLGNHRAFGGVPVAGLNARAHAILRALRRARELATAAGVGDLFVLGDLFDTASPSPQLLAAALDALAGRDARARVHLLRGNHDMVSDAPGDHALGVFAHAGVRVWETPDVLVGDRARIAVVPYLTGSTDARLPPVLRDLASRVQEPLDVVLLHAGIHDPQLRATLPWAAGAHDAVSTTLLAGVANAARRVYAGNWHTARDWVLDGGLCVHQVGALVPTGWDNPGLDGYGRLMVLDTSANTSLVYQVGGPRFVHADSPAELEALRAQAAAASPDPVSLYVRADATPDGIADARAWLDRAVSDGVAAGYAVRVGSEQVRAAAREAAAAARSAHVLDDAVHAYVGRMPLPDGVDRAEVLDRTREYLLAT